MKEILPQIFPRFYLMRADLKLTKLRKFQDSHLNSGEIELHLMTTIYIILKPVNLLLHLKSVCVNSIHDCVDLGKNFLN